MNFGYIEIELNEQGYMKHRKVELHSIVYINSLYFHRQYDSFARNDRLIIMFVLFC